MRDVAFSGPLLVDAAEAIGGVNAEHLHSIKSLIIGIDPVRVRGSGPSQ